MNNEVSLNYKNELQIDITPDGAARTWAAICKGFSNLAEGVNEVLHQASYLCDLGWGSTEVTGGQYICTLTGVRYFNNQAQDFIFSDAVMYGFGAARKTTLRIVRQNAAIIEWDVTLANVSMSGGDANKPAAISVAIHGNGAPRLLTDIYLDPLKVVSVAGADATHTQVYVNPALAGAGNSYKYKTADAVDLPAFDEVLITGWTAWNGAAEIVSAAGNVIVIAEVETSSNKAKKAGVADVTVGA